MPHSMTGFASAATAVGAYELTWELRSVNHRYLDISLRLPEEFRRLESLCRDAISSQIKRGKVDGSLRATATSGSALPAIDGAALTELGSLEAQVLAKFPAATPLSVSEIFRFNGVLTEPEQKLEIADETVVDALKKATAALRAARQTEGERTAAFINARLADIETAIAAVDPIRELAAARYREKLLERISQVDAEPHNDRLEQELAFIAQRMDIAEEIDRLASHTAEIHKILVRDEPIGRRLDFLIQELNREANTMASKSQDERLTKICVDLKVVIEQIREQVQNLE